MKTITLPKTDDAGNPVSDEISPTVDELRRDLLNGKRVLRIDTNAVDTKPLFAGGPDTLDGDALRGILTEAAATNVEAAVFLEYWNGGKKALRKKLREAEQQRELFSDRCAQSGRTLLIH